MGPKGTMTRKASAPDMPGLGENAPKQEDQEAEDGEEEEDHKQDDASAHACHCLVELLLLLGGVLKQSEDEREYVHGGCASGG